MTHRQSELLRFIREYQRTHSGVTPSYQEMVEALSLGSKSAAHRLVACLQRDGWIERRYGACRHIVVLHEPEVRAS